MRIDDNAPKQRTTTWHSVLSTTTLLDFFFLQLALSKSSTRANPAVTRKPYSITLEQYYGGIKFTISASFAAEAKQSSWWWVYGVPCSAVSVAALPLPTWVAWGKVDERGLKNQGPTCRSAVLAPPSSFM
jgi:hypothetical protein